MNETPGPPTCETCSWRCDAQCANSPACHTRGSLVPQIFSTPSRWEQSLVGGRAHQLAIHTSGGLQTSVTPRRVNTFGPQRSDWLTLLRRRRLCTRLCPCVRRIWSGIIVLTLGSQLSPLRVISATIPASPHVRILVLPLGLMRLGSTDGATLSICCLNASVSPTLTDL